MHRWSIVIGLLFLASGVWLAIACAPSPPAPPAEKPAALEKPKTGGIARFGTTNAPPNAFPYENASSSPVVATFSGGPVFEPLVGTDYNTGKDWRVDFPLDPKLAEKWEASADAKTWTFKLRPGVQWHDGKPLTVEDVLWSLSYIKDPKNAHESGGLVKDVDKMEKVDEGTIRITLKAPNPFFVYDISQETTAQALFIMPKHVFDAGGVEALRAKGIGTGPLKLVKLDPAGTTIMARNENYWRKDAQGRSYPYIAGAEFVHNMERATQEAAFAAGELDMIHIATKTLHDALKALYKDFDTQTHYTFHGTGLYFNISKKPFDDIRVRRAIHLAVDRHEMNETLGGGYLKISGPVVPGAKEGWGFSQEELLKLPGFRKDKTADLAEAKKLLADAGYGAGLKVNLIGDRAWGSAFMAEYIPTTLKRAGIDVELRLTDGAIAEKAIREGDYNMAWRHIANEKPIIRQASFFYSKGVFAKGAGINDPKMDSLIDEMQMATSWDEQKKVVRRLAEYHLETLYGINIADPAFFRGEQKWFKDYRTLGTATASPGGSLYMVWLDQDLMPAKRKR